MGEKPTAALVLSLIGGIFVLLIGLGITALAGMFPQMMMVGGLSLAVLGVLGILNGLLMMVFGILLYTRPQQHAMFGALVLVLSIVSWLTTLGGFFIGFLLGLIGGILGIVWKPQMMQPAMMPKAVPPSTPPQ